MTLFKIKEIKAGQRGIDVESAIVMGVEPAREVFTKKGPMKVQDILLGDDTGEITLTRWEEDVGKFAVGDRIDIENAYVTLYRGKLSLNTGKFGKAVKAI